jgi:hypothetical protein
MKVQYKLKTNRTADLILEDINPEQLEFIRVLLHDVTKHNTLFDKSDREELSGQNVIEQIARQLKNE